MSYILYAEDDPDDQQALKDILREIDPYLKVVLLPTGLALIQYLETLSLNEEWPSFVVLDMNMPVWDGIRTLRAMKEHQQYARLPVVMFSTSNLKSDANLSLKHGAVKFISKPVRQADMDTITQQFASICQEFAGA